MKTLGICLALMLAAANTLPAQSNVRAHYADGQVWVVWDVQNAVVTNCVPTLTPVISNGVPVVVSNCLPATYAIYASPNPVTNTANATLVGRLFAQEWSAAILRDNVNAAFGYRPTGFQIPDGSGGYQTLATNEGVFVHTVRSNFTAHYAVRPFGVTAAPAAWRSGPVTATFSTTPGHVPTAHLQAQGTNDGYPVEWWTFWADGDADRTAGRTDFPVMENHHKRGAPHNFFVCEPKVGVLPPANRPATVAVHSGDAQAKMWLPENSAFKSVGLTPVGGLLVAVEDRQFSVVRGVADAASVLSTGYVPGFDPFRDAVVGPGFAPVPADLPPNNAMIHPYPVWRMNWTLDWLYANKGVDSNRVAGVGHSGGAKGLLTWSHAHPERFAVANFYGPSLGDFPEGDERRIGVRAQNLPLLLTNRLGQLARSSDIHQLTASFSPARDLPFARVFLGKREENWVVDDNLNGRGDITEQYEQADALGLGAALFWDLREHGVGNWTYAEMVQAVMNPRACTPNPTVNITGSWSSNDLWVATLATQFRRDDATNQVRHRADVSYPAFFNCALLPRHGDPGTVIYTNNTVPFDGRTSYDGLVTTTECRPPWTGDRRGTWGGYFDWEPGIADTETNWSTVIFLVGAPSAFSPVEICPDPVRVVDVAIRRPQHFQPRTGTRLDWRLENAATGTLLTNGTAVVGTDDLVSVPGLPIPRDPQRTRLTVSVAASGPSNGCFSCTQVIGYSQVGALNGWFVKDGVFESIAGNDQWQLLWNNGATLEDWQDPNHPYWSNALVSPCANNSTTPDRVLINLASRTYGTNLAAWVGGINATIDTIVLKYPGVRQIVLQPIVGGPGHSTCDIAGQPVRASESHPHMDTAIALVAAARSGTQPEVVAGLSPEVRACTDYADALGHFTPDGAIAAAQAIGQYYAALDAVCLPPEPCPAPVLSIQQLTNDLVELSWPSCPSNYYQIEWTRTFRDWRALTPPLAAPPNNSTMTWTTTVSPPYQFFRLVVGPLISTPVPTTPGIYGNLRLEHGGITRSYRLNIPTGYTGDASAPLMLAIHGHNQTAESFAGNQPELAALANSRGVILVFPDATKGERGTGWNASDPTPEHPVDDVGFLLALIDELASTLNIDRKRVYAGGFSNGGQMCHFLGARTTNVFAALAAVGSGIAGDRGTGSLTYIDPPTQPLPVLIVNATNDCKRLYWGGISEDGVLQGPAFDQVIHWTNANLCAPSPVITTNVVVTNHVRRVFADTCAGPYPPFNAPVTNLVIREHYQLTCTPGTEVLFVTLTDGGHKWPESNDNVGFSASREALDFFLRHCRCDATAATDPLVIPTAPGRYDLRLCDQNYSRLFRLQIPAGYNPANPTPIVFAMHGGGQTMPEFASQHPALFAKCDFENVILLLPEALDHPQSREPLWMNKPFDYVVDDRSFITNLLGQLSATLNVDPRRVYATGFSGGGSFSHWLAATTPGLLAAIAPVCTQTGWNEPDQFGPIVAPPPPLEPMPVLMVRGSLDSKRPFNGGLNIDGVQCRSAADDLAYWTAANTCVGAPVNTVNLNVTTRHYQVCAGTIEVILVAVGGMPHLWPDATDGFNFDANTMVIDFLLRHARP